MMRELVSTYPYLIACLGGTGILGVWLALCPGQRKPALLSGALGMPFGLAGALLVPAYWEPRTVWSVCRIGIEDVLFSFVVGGLAWLLFAGLLRNRGALDIRWRFVLVGYVAMNLLGLLFFGVAWKIVSDPMAAALLSFAVGALLLLSLRPGFWRVALAGALGFGLVYGLYAKLCFWLLPAFAASWPETGCWGAQVCGIPQGEIAWAVSYGASWPLFMATLFRVEMKKELK